MYPWNPIFHPGRLYFFAYNKKASVLYQAVTRINIRESSVTELLNDPLLIEKFHPTDGINLGVD